MESKIDPGYGEWRTLLELLRLGRNQSRQDLASAAGVAIGTVYGAERMGRRPHRSTVRALASALEVDAGWLLSSFDEEGPPPPPARELVAQEHEADVVTG